MNYRNHVLWSGEFKGLVLYRWHVWWRPGEEYQEHFVLPTVKHGGGSIMVWDCGSFWETWYLCLNVLVKWCCLNRSHDFRKWIRQMCLTSLMQPLFLCNTTYITIHKYYTMRYFISVVTMPFLKEYKSHFSWQLMPTVLSEECSENPWAMLTLQRCCCNDLMMTVDITVLKPRVVTVPIALIAIKITANSKHSCCAEMTNASCTEQRQPLHPSTDF